MFAKKCPHCQRWSYSAADIGDWLCPYCNHNLRDVPAVPSRVANGEQCGEAGEETRGKEESTK